MKQSRALSRQRLAKACDQLDPAEERALAEEGLAADTAAWPSDLIGALDSAKDIPSDLAERHDDYLYGDPKRDRER